MIRKVTNILNIIKKHIAPQNDAVLYLSLVISTFLPLGMAYLLYPSIFDNQMEYSDLIVGMTTWDGYYKAGDLQLLFIYCLLYAILLVLVPFILNRIVKKGENKSVARATIGYPKSFLMSFAIGCAITHAITKTLSFEIVLVFGVFCIIYYLLKTNPQLHSSKIFAKQIGRAHV